MSDVSFGVTANELLGGMRELVGDLAVTKTVVEIENAKLKHTVTEQAERIQQLEAALQNGQQTINDLAKKLDEARPKRYKVRKKPAAQT